MLENIFVFSIDVSEYFVCSEYRYTAADGVRLTGYVKSTPLFNVNNALSLY